MRVRNLAGPRIVAVGGLEGDVGRMGSAGLGDVDGRLTGSDGVREIGRPQVDVEVGDLFGGRRGLVDEWGSWGPAAGPLDGGWRGAADDFEGNDFFDRLGGFLDRYSSGGGGGLPRPEEMGGYPTFVNPGHAVAGTGPAASGGTSIPSWTVGVIGGSEQGTGPHETLAEKALAVAGAIPDRGPYGTLPFDNPEFVTLLNSPIGSAVVGVNLSVTKGSEGTESDRSAHGAVKLTFGSAPRPTPVEKPSGTSAPQAEPNRQRHRPNPMDEGYRGGPIVMDPVTRARMRVEGIYRRPASDGPVRGNYRAGGVAGPDSTDWELLRGGGVTDPVGDLDARLRVPRYARRRWRFAGASDDPTVFRGRIVRSR